MIRLIHWLTLLFHGGVSYAPTTFAHLDDGGPFPPKP
jgi:hypothetical protein